MKKIVKVIKIVMIFVLLLILSACASPQTYRITYAPLDMRYHSMLNAPQSNERVIDNIYVGVPDNEKWTYLDGIGTSDFFPSLGRKNERKGWALEEAFNLSSFKPLYRTGRFSYYKDGSTISRRFYIVDDITIPNRSGKYLDQILDIAREKFPNESVDLKNVRGNVNTSIDLNTRRIGLVFSADIVVTSPMPQPVTYTADIRISESAAGQIVSVDGSVIGQISIAAISRADLYRRAHNYLTDTNHRTKTENADFQAIKFETENMELGRIRGVYTFNVQYGTEWYRFSTTFTIDFHDARAQIRFDEAKLINGKPILLQAIADAARQELKRFTDNMISSITS